MRGPSPPTTGRLRYVVGMLVSMLLGCLATEAEDPEDPWASPVDYEGLCVSWPANECPGRACEGSEVEETYKAAFLTYAVEQTGFPPEELDDHVQLRRVDTSEAAYSSYTEFEFLVRVGWAQAQVELSASADGGNPSESEALAALSERAFPKPHWQATVIPFEEAEAAVAACEAQLGVDFPETGWCDARVTNEADEDDAWMSFRFTVETSATTYAYVMVSPDPAFPAHCVEENRYDE